MAALNAAPAAEENIVVASLKDAILAGVLALILFSIIVGLRTDAGAGGLQITTEWDRVLWMAAVTAVGRFLLNIFFWKRAGGPKGLSDVLPDFNKAGHVSRFLGPLMLGIAVTLPFIVMVLVPGQSRYYVDLGVLVLTYVMLGWGLNIVVGLAGLLDLGYVAFYAVGAYSYALLSQYFDLGFWVCLPLAGILAAFWGIILGFPVLRLRGDYLAIVTLAFGEIIRIVLLNWFELTNGPNGITQIPRPTFFGLDFTRDEGGFADFFGLEYAAIHRIIFLYYIILVLALITNWVTLRLRKLPIGRAWEALREDEIACRSLGINTTNTKLSAFAIGAMFGGFAGAFFATRQGFISPESFTFLESAIILAIVVLGGLGSQMGVVFASLVMIGGFEMFRNLEEFRVLVFGLLMVLIMIWKPRGLVSTRNPTVFLKERKAVSADLVSQGEGH
ncbi:high-affinity branched-chain amino acid ABC transporter permease LivM [Georhizobium sp. MAB10]|jgi:branched-chain amino acid transport system permease protein|uniref:high-affinity branched-chain amino acid ABC transporter permease LivM n=1 Tax=Georhizobium sp. MAB10 TaxID=3028319 RepID=UPI0038560AAE